MHTSCPGATHRRIRSSLVPIQTGAPGPSPSRPVQPGFTRVFEIRHFRRPRQKARRLVPRAEFLATAGQTYPESFSRPPRPVPALHEPRGGAHLPPAARPMPSRRSCTPGPHSSAHSPAPSPRRLGRPTLRDGGSQKAPPDTSDPTTPPRGRVPRGCQRPRKGVRSGAECPVSSPPQTPSPAPRHSPSQGSGVGRGGRPPAAAPTLPLPEPRAPGPTRAWSGRGRGRGDAPAPG